MRTALSSHWPEYLMEAAGLAAFMLSACAFATLLSHSASPVLRLVTHPAVRRGLMGVAMGLTAVGVIYSPWGRRSGAHINPAVTLTFLRLGKVAPWDAGFYIAAQFTGGVVGMLTAAAILRGALADRGVAYIATRPGPGGVAVAFVAEAAISFGLMAVVLLASNTPRLARFTGLLAGLLIAVYITVEAPLSGMSMNPARSFASAAVGALWTSLWLYFVAPTLGMGLAAAAYRRARRPVRCAKLVHPQTGACIFRCEFATPAPRPAAPACPASPPAGASLPSPS